MVGVAVSNNFNYKDLSYTSKNKSFNKYWVVIFLFSMVAMGGVTGFALSRLGNKETIGSGSVAGTKIIKTEKMVGSTDKIYKDSAQGVLKKGGLDGEGTHRLERKGGDDQTVYLTSSVIDLNPFTGKTVTVWGETFQAEKAGWLMDVGRVEIN